MEIRKTHTSPRHPQGNGQTERFNKTLVQMIRSYIKEDQQDWDQHLYCLAAAYRSSIHETTGFTPNFLMLGREIRLPGELVAEPTPETIPESYATYLDTLREKMNQAHESVRKHLKAAIEKQQDRYDYRLLHLRYKPGDLVWYRNDQMTEGVCLKLQPTYIGPCLILENYSDLDHLIQKKESGRLSVVHHNRLKPYEGETIPRWILKRRKQMKYRDGH